MARKIVDVEIEGTSPLLMHHRPLVEADNLKNLPAEEQAEYAAYRDPDTKDLYIPAECMYATLVAAGVYTKGKGRSSAQKMVAASVFVRPAKLLLGTKKFAVDSRYARIKKDQILRHRPRLEKWKCGFEVDFDDTLISEKNIRKILDDAGKLVGVLDFRPACKGPFGCFMVTTWKVRNGDA
jgi:hypothetical protein